MRGLISFLLSVHECVWVTGRLGAQASSILCLCLLLSFVQRHGCCTRQALQQQRMPSSPPLQQQHDACGNSARSAAAAARELVAGAVSVCPGGTVCLGLCPRTFGILALAVHSCSRQAGRQAGRLQETHAHRVTNTPCCSDRAGSEFGAPANLGYGGLVMSDRLLPCMHPSPLSLWLFCGTKQARRSKLCQPVWCPFSVFSWYVCWRWLGACLCLWFACLWIFFFQGLLQRACLARCGAPATHALRCVHTVWLLDFWQAGRRVKAGCRCMYVPVCSCLCACVRVCLCASLYLFPP